MEENINKKEELNSPKEEIEVSIAPEATSKSVENTVSHILLEDYEEKIEPKVNKQIVEELKKLRVVFSNLNERLGEIQRLSLGNPRKQSLCDTFATIDDALNDAKGLFPYYEENKVPCIENIKGIVTRMKKVACLKRPLEKNVEQLKMLLGDCDGRVLIIAKCLSM